MTGVKPPLSTKTVTLTAEEWFNSGYSKGESGDNQGAIADYNQAINLKPDYSLAYYNRGVDKDNLGDKQGAIAEYNKAAQLYSQQNKMDDYLDALNQVKKLQK
ncbi:tetratricopeptide repeat protein [Crocosphaera sp.]|uniref:tetratricopeptide repeat protein n=1 Tax=Crocosphaera sp. TaxID=2729996 RepID=UPI002622836D|nr:tetratricopeptide repeat protein [Crocosphaera sp.]MDJ0582208.1 tetratricopeptide repeat protein [Crocosphaera sp.]